MFADRVIGGFKWLTITITLRSVFIQSRIPESDCLDRIDCDFIEISHHEHTAIP